MKLIYLYVDGYKSLKDFEITLTNKYNFTLGRDDKNPISISHEENPKYVDFFGNNNEIFALIGKNGSGKSSILEAISKIHADYNQPLKTYDYKFIAIFEKDNKIYIRTNLKVNSMYSDADVSIFSSVYISPQINENILNNRNNEFGKIFFKNRYLEPILPYNPNKYTIPSKVTLNKLTGLININLMDHPDLFNWINDLINNNDSNKQDVIIFDRYRLEFNYKNISNKIKTFAMSYFTEPGWSKKHETMQYLSRFLLNITKELPEYLENYPYLFENNTNKNPAFEINYERLKLCIIACYIIYLLDNIISSSDNINKLDSFNENLNKIEYTQAPFNEKQQLISLLECLNNIEFKGKDSFINKINDIDEIYESFINNHFEVNGYDEKVLLGKGKFFNNHIKYLKRTYDSGFDNTLYSNKESMEEKEFKEFIIDFLDFNYYNSKNKKHSICTLSEGEKSIIYLISRYLLNTKVNNILYDEPSNDFHPEWQRNLIYYINESNKKSALKDKLIIISSHSPLIISDLPSENVIYLEKDDNSNTKIKPNTQKTFGANLIDLYNNGFHVDYTIGEFARKYILEFIEHKDSKTTEEKEAFLEMLGDPVIKAYVESQLFKDNNYD